MNNQFQLPEMAYVRQKLFNSKINDISFAVNAAVEKLSALRPEKPGETVAVAVGSRNIDKLDVIVCQILLFLKQKGFKPFIVPAMGSHGGATPEGQKKLIEHFRITEDAMDVPILAEMDTECVGRLPSGLNLYISKAALSADHIVLINRIKCHTKFSADIESGLCKMMTIGLGKDKGAGEFHRFAVQHTFSIIEEAAGYLISKLKILFGVALVEDGRGNLSQIETVFPHSMIEEEKKLLKKATCMMARIPFDNLDILIVDFIGKDISGIGMDSNVTGRHRDIVGDVYDWPHAKRIFVRDLSAASEGNANGIGLADFTTNRLVDKIDFHKTFINSLTAISPEKASVPIHFENDRRCLESCAKTTGVELPEALRMVRIKNTASLEVLEVSKALEHEINSNPDLKQITKWKPFSFDQSNNLLEFENYG